MTEILFAEGSWQLIRQAVDSTENEVAGVCLAHEVCRDGETVLLVREVALGEGQDVLRQSSTGATLRPEFVAATAARARQCAASLVYFHSHPFSEAAEFSCIDDAGESALRRFLDRRVPDRTHCALVVGRSAVAARVLGTTQSSNVRVVGPTVQELSREGHQGPEARDSDAYHRQVLAFGEEGQRRLQRAHVAVVGLGGTGSLVAEWLARLGVLRLIFIDPDLIEESNLNRVAGAHHIDVGRPKVDVARDHVLRINPRLAVAAHRADVTAAEVAKIVTEAHAVFGCTDSHGSRAILNQIAAQYLIPYFDVGVGIFAHNELVTRVVGRAQMIAPGLACLACQEGLDSEQVRRDLLSEYERQQDPYIVGAHVTQPAVVSLNATVASLAISMFLAAFAHVPLAARHQHYDATLGAVRPVASTPDGGCIVCSAAGALARGNSWPMPGRRSSAPT